MKPLGGMLFCVGLTIAVSILFPHPAFAHDCSDTTDCHPSIAAAAAAAVAAGVLAGLLNAVSAAGGIVFGIKPVDPMTAAKEWYPPLAGIPSPSPGGDQPIESDPFGNTIIGMGGSVLAAIGGTATGWGGKGHFLPGVPTSAEEAATDLAAHGLADKAVDQALEGSEGGSEGEKKDPGGSPPPM